MELITGSRKILGKYFPKDLRNGVYVMQDSRNPQQFITGAVGTWDTFSPGIVQQCSAAYRRLLQHTRLAQGWKYVFFTPTLSPDTLYVAEAALYGRLCMAFRGTKNSRFEIGDTDTVEDVQKIAGEAMNSILMSPQYSPKYLYPNR